MKLQSDKIYDIIEWYQETDSPDLAILMLNAKFLSCQLVPLGEAIGFSFREFNNKHTLRRKHMADQRRAVVNARSVSSAEAERIVEESAAWKELYDTEYKAKTDYENAKTFKSAIEAVIGRMNQEIAQLRMEQREYLQADLVETVVKKINEQNRRLAQKEPQAA